MKNKKLFIFLFLLIFSFKASASDICSKNGYTIVTINGIFTNEDGAILNKSRLKQILPKTINLEPVNIDYLYNSTHLAGVGDIVDVVKQGFFDSKTDFDLVEMLNDASLKVKTQKLLLVGHSQGNFYANNFYNKVASKTGGVPSESIGVYGVATPADRVASGGKYLTSDTDKVIATLVGSVKNIMTPNTHIELQENGNGHSFSDVYLKYRGGQIVSDIKSSLNNLRINQIQDTQSPCISPQEISLGHKIGKAIINIADVVVNTSISVGTFIANKISNTATTLFGFLSGNSNKNLASAGSFNQNLVSDDNQIIESENIPINTDVIDNKEKTILETQKENINIEEEPILNDENENTPEIPDNISEEPVVIKTGNNNGSSSGGSSGGSSSGGNGGSNPTVISDTTAPVITLNGENIINLTQGDIYTEFGATAIDNVDGSITIVIAGSVDISTIGTYTITYTATDKANNISTKTRTINVIKKEDIIVPVVDKTAPVITIIGDPIVNISLNQIYTDLGATAIDEIDGETLIIVTGSVDTTNIGTYTITYTATDKAKNTTTKNRTVNVLNNAPIVSKVATLSLPNLGDYAGDGLNPNRGRRNLTPFIFEVIYTDINNNAPQNIKLYVKNTTTGISLPEVSMTKVSQNGDALSDGNYINGELYTVNKIYDTGEYSYYFKANDNNGNYTLVDENNSLRFSAIPSNYTYIPQYSFGINNGDGRDWQVWSFNGSNAFDWTDTYVNNYLREQFKIQAYSGGFWCSQCLQRGIFNHDPQKGFELTDLTTSGLEGNPQNNMNGVIYNVILQWDSTGYTYTVSHGAIVDSTGHTDVPNMNNDMWVGWDGSYNGFRNFPYGNWQGVVYASPMERTGGSDMVLQPYPVYNSNSIPNPEPDPNPVLSSEKSITSFNFEGLSPVVNGVVSNTNSTINLTVPYGTNITSLVPTIIISDKASISPLSNIVQNFTNPVSYTVKAEDGSTKVYTITVIVSPNPNPEPDNSLPIISSYTLNGNQNSITTNPLVNNTSIVLNANKNVNWMSIKIEKEDDVGVYKMFQSGISCVDGTNTCSKTWDGILTKGGLLQNGNYRIKVHMQDVNKNDFEDYISGIISVQQ
jgi:hypothetical protein